ncbi:hypothetical protein [uncultured Aquimarina sp.]|uniref:hypothetical protein n=1 Tax=uncultured Aquimarina sp. TaxID=575652 RepID=UPI0026111FBF|nr:hypothetical protein [uncultured Aquimarina sp.]
MKNKIVILIVLFFTTITFGQEHKLDTISGKVKSFSFSPIHSNVSQVNGLVFGVGHYGNRNIEHQRINGVNIDVIHPAPLLLMTFGLEIPFKLLPIGLTYDNSSGIHVLDSNNKSNKVKLSMNGLNLSVGGFYEGTDFSGLNISLVSIVNDLNGISLAPIVNGSEDFNGIQVSALANISAGGNGLQVAISNVAGKFNGIQLGLFNKSTDQRGFQFGLWNRNARRSLPFINWQFSKKKVKSKTS